PALLRLDLQRRVLRLLRDQPAPPAVLRAGPAAAERSADVRHGSRPADRRGGPVGPRPRVGARSAATGSPRAFGPRGDARRRAPRRRARTAGRPGPAALPGGPVSSDHGADDAGRRARPRADPLAARTRGSG